MKPKTMQGKALICPGCKKPMDPEKMDFDTKAVLRGSGKRQKWWHRLCHMETTEEYVLMQHLFELQELRQFAEQIARLYIAGEVRDLGDGTYSEYGPDGRSDNDALALYRLIEDARELTGVRPDCLVDKRTLNHCDDCWEWFPIDKPECPVCGWEVR